VITGVGDRRDEDIMSIGKLSSEMFDEIIIRLDKDLRGREGNEIVDLLQKGIQSGHSCPVEVIPTEKEAITKAIQNAKNDSLIVISTEAIGDTLQIVKDLKELEANA
jgi:cyanophycin synthetase